MTLKHLTLTTLTLASLFSTSTFANGDYQMSCNVNINGNIAFANNELTVESASQESILFTATGAVLLDGKPVTLSAEEKALALRYYKDVEASIPMVVDVTLEALKITDIALEEVFTGLLGAKSKVPQTLNVRINDIANSVKEHVYQDPNSLTFNSAQLKSDLGVGDKLEQEIEQMKAEIVSSVMGQLIVAIGQSMMNGGGNFAQLEARMGSLAQDIELKAKELGASLKEKSGDLCDKMKSLDETETQLQKVSKLGNLDTIYFYKKA